MSFCPGGTASFPSACHQRGTGGIAHCLKFVYFTLHFQSLNNYRAKFCLMSKAFDRQIVYWCSSIDTGQKVRMIQKCNLSDA